MPLPFHSMPEGVPVPILPGPVPTQPGQEDANSMGGNYPLLFHSSLLSLPSLPSLSDGSLYDPEEESKGGYSSNGSGRTYKQPNRAGVKKKDKGKQEKKRKEDDGGSTPPKRDPGRWTPEEHLLFLKGLELHGKSWKRISEIVKTRTVVQIRTHAQKYLIKLEKAKKKQAEQKAAELSMGGAGGKAPSLRLSPSDDLRRLPSKMMQQRQAQPGGFKPQPHLPWPLGAGFNPLGMGPFYPPVAPMHRPPGHRPPSHFPGGMSLSPSSQARLNRAMGLHLPAAQPPSRDMGTSVSPSDQLLSGPAASITHTLPHMWGGMGAEGGWTPVSERVARRGFALAQHKAGCNLLQELQNFLLEDSSHGSSSSSSPEAVPLPGPMSMSPSQDLSLDIFPSDMDMTLLDSLCDMAASPRKSTAFWNGATEAADPLALFGEGFLPAEDDWGWLDSAAAQQAVALGAEGLGPEFAQV